MLLCLNWDHEAEKAQKLIRAGHAELEGSEDGEEEDDGDDSFASGVRLPSSPRLRHLHFGKLASSPSL